MISFFRRGESDDECVVVLYNFTPVTRHDYRVGVPFKSSYEEIFNRNHHEFGGSNALNRSDIYSDDWEFHGRPFSISVSLPPLGVT
ncbi:MAG: alpha amylase C-terminal domain-containing protein [Cyclobacteriaceae bacterium]